MQKDQAYHKAAIIYNEKLAECAEELAPTLEHEEVKKWCTSVGKQHRFHAKRHRLALNKLLLKQEAPPVESIPDGLDVPDPELSAAEESDVETPSEETPVVNAEQAGGNPPLADGCSPFHNPTDPNCEFYPDQANEVSNG